jgi:hypothetical protein
MTEAGYWCVTCPVCGVPLQIQPAEIGEDNLPKQPPGDPETTFTEFCHNCTKTSTFKLKEVWYKTP